MNIRENLLNSNSYSFREANARWDENPVFYLKKVISQSNLNNLLNTNQIYLGLTEKPLIFLENLNFDKSKIKPDLLLFASRHTSKTARPAFLVHTTGNWGRNNDFGGIPQMLSKTSALIHKANFESLREQIVIENFTGFSLDIEVTHHGPTNLEIPLIFIELGSSKQEWVIKEAGQLVANAIVNSVFKYLIFKKEKNQKVGLGFGGTHYAPNLNRLITNNDIALSFICPKYYIQELNENLIKMMINNTLEEIDYFIVDWKGTNSEDKKHLIPLFEKFDMPVRKTRSFSTI
ncbi:MAG TPA: D-aminoacyl-tRNA deacylase [Candidatus Nanopelagicaceae bacterium]|jgi:D-aminoacyl-tRNA deacylase|nr:D-aminoacyl-tRNA deacylase [Candidatus Nanopelagicaceae bacterium]